MLRDLTPAMSIYIASGYTDLRNGIDGLAGIVEREFNLNPCDNMLFLFCGRRADRIKGLYWEGDGYLLLYKRLETGRFKWPRNKKEVLKITPQQFKWLMEGLRIEQPTANKIVKKMKVS